MLKLSAIMHDYTTIIIQRQYVIVIYFENIDSSGLSNNIYPMFTEPTITWVISGFSGHIWLDTKIVFKKI